MKESLIEACSEFEQLLLAGMLRSAAGSIASTAKSDAEDTAESGFAAMPREESEGYTQLFAQALAGAIERAGGVGVARMLATAAGGPRP